MNVLKFIMLSIAVTVFVFACKAKETEIIKAPSKEKEQVQAKVPSYGTEQAKAPSYGAMAGSIEKGKALFNDTMFGNGTAVKSCNSCHLGGKGLEMAGEKKEFNIMGKKQNSLEEAVNFCIEMALKGTAIDPDGKDMMNIVAYIKSLQSK